MLRKTLVGQTSGTKLKMRRRPALKTFARDRKGATAVEFAIVALPFFMMIFATFELALVFLISLTLDNATATAARAIRTGNNQASGGGTTSAGAVAFGQTICNNLGWLQGQCQVNSTLFVDVRVLSGGFGSSSPAAINNGAVNSQNFCFYSGNAGDIVLVRTYYKWPLLTPFLNNALSRLGNGVALISSTATFKNEPFGGTAQSGGTTC